MLQGLVLPTRIFCALNVSLLIFSYRGWFCEKCFPSDKHPNKNLPRAPVASPCRAGIRPGECHLYRAPAALSTT
jgi:hypothetical protein